MLRPLIGCRVPKLADKERLQWLGRVQIDRSSEDLNQTGLTEEERLNLYEELKTS
jgi:hypothetical protein